MWVLGYTTCLVGEVVILGGSLGVNGRDGVEV